MIRSVICAVLLFGFTFVEGAEAGLVMVTWNPSNSEDVAGYRLDYGSAPGRYTQFVDVGPTTVWNLTLPSGTHFIAVRAYNSARLYSDPSNEVAIVVDPPYSSTVGDLDGDGVADLLWQHQTQGWLSAWLMSGTSMRIGLLLAPAQVTDTNWKVAGTGDFNRDGHADLVWQNQATGQISLWTMNGTQMITGQLFSPGQVADLNWKIAGVGDFNRDGWPDLVWQHQQSGMISTWLMNGTSLVEGRLLTPDRVANTAWKIRAVADMDRDGQSDLIWQNTADGTVSAWLMSGTSMRQGLLLSPSQVADLGWKIAGVADLNRDGWIDLVWQHRGDGRVSTWLMQGITMINGMLLSPGQIPDTDWQLVGPK